MFNKSATMRFVLLYLLFISSNCFLIRNVDKVDENITSDSPLNISLPENITKYHLRNPPRENVVVRVPCSGGYGKVDNICREEFKSSNCFFIGNNGITDKIASPFNITTESSLKIEMSSPREIVVRVPCTPGYGKVDGICREEFKW